jgi:hypothetical protein
MPTLAEFEQAAPELAAIGRRRIERDGLLLAATLRRDGTPRISPIETYLVEGELVLSVWPGTMKDRDLARDPRVLLHSLVTSAHDPADEFKLRGRARRIADERMNDAARDVIEAAHDRGWRPPEDWTFYAVDIDDVAHVSGEYPALEIEVWPPRSAAAS